VSSPKKPPSSFGDYFSSVRPLASRPKRIPPVPSTPAERPDATIGPSEPSFEVHDDGVHFEGWRSGCERMLRDLGRGAIAISDRIDLHGLTAEEARLAMHRFCLHARGPHRRGVLIVHGKGTHSPGGRGILRDEMATWLSTPPLSRHVLCFVTARPEDGGSGAVYVLLAPRP